MPTRRGKAERGRSFLRRPASALIPLFLFALLAFSSVREKSAAYDEPLHITGGYSYWLTNDYRLHPTNGNLLQRWIALPVFLGEFRFPGLDQEAWWWPYFHGRAMIDQFFHAQGNDQSAMLARARTMIILLAVTLGWVVYRWSRRLFGWRGGLVSILLFCFSPTMIAHGQLATSDMAAALFFLLAVLGIWNCLHAVTLRNVMLSSLATAGLFLAKFSAPLLLPMAAIMVAVRLLRAKTLRVALGERSWNLAGRGRQLLAFTTLTAVHAGVAIIAIWACYGFRYAAFVDPVEGRDRFSETWEVLEDNRSPLATHLVALARNHQLLPESYLYGQLHTIKFSEKRASFLAGECSYDGWRHYFLVCFALKTSLAVPGVLVLAVLAGVFRWRAPVGPNRRRLRVLHALYRTTPLWSLLLVYCSASIASHLNLGVRHIVPIYPALFILGGAAAWWLQHSRRLAAVLVLVLGFHVFECVRVYPNYLAYFNQVTLGADNGYKYLVDCNLDWGQEFISTAQWLRTARPRGPVYCSCFESVRKTYFGIHAPRIDEAILREIRTANPLPLRGGTYIVSATTLSAANDPRPRWTPLLERDYRAALYLFTHPHKLPSDANVDELGRVLARFEGNRMLAYLRQRQPDEQVNHAVLVFRVTDAEVRDAMLGPIVDRTGWWGDASGTVPSPSEP